MDGGGCRTSYHYNFFVKNGCRVYYDGIPDIIQVGRHQFIERRVIELWINSMLVSWTSATNCACLYNLSLAQGKIPPADWSFNFSLTSDHVWIAFIILTLLEDLHARNQTLVVQHAGAHKDRFTDAIRARNIRFRLYNQPELRHYCDRCLRLYGDGATARKVWAVVIDGVTIGHPCCAIHNCHVPLTNNQHRFCPRHAVTHDKICSIVGCNEPATEGHRVCSIPSHQAVEKTHRERGQARFQLKDRLRRARMAHPNDSLAEDGSQVVGDRNQ